MNKIIKLSFVSLLLCGGLSFLIATQNKGNETQPVFAYTTGDADTYYSGISDDLNGQNLTNALNALNISRRKTTVGYGSLPSNFRYTDYDPDKGYGSTTLLSFYSGKAAVYSGNMNREHVWPNSRGGNKVEDDIHMIRPTLTSENSSRGNSFFAESGAWDPASFDNPSYRGDAARIILYSAIADTSLKLVDKNNVTSSETGYNTTMGKLSDLLKWNLQYPVSQREKNRNEGAEGLQGNRNPFIDHPEYGCRIWGDTNDKTREICSGQYTPVDPDVINVVSVSLNKGKLGLGLNDTFQLTANILPTNATNKKVTWSSEDNQVATVSNSGLVTAVGVGETTITVTTVDQNKTATCEVVVEEETPVLDENHGLSMDDPLTPQEAIELCNEAGDAVLAKANGVASEFFVEGVFDEGTTYSTQYSAWGGTLSSTGFVISDAKNNTGKTLKNTNGELDGKKVICKGYIELYRGTFKMGYLPASVTPNGQKYNPSIVYIYDDDNPEPPVVTLNSITVTSPTKTEYEVEELKEFKLDLTGFKVTAKYSDNSTKDVTAKATLSDVDFTKEGEQTITVTYSENNITKTGSFKITIVLVEPPVVDELTGITVTPPTKVEYLVDESLDLTGMKVIAHYTVSEDKDVTSECVAGAVDMSKVGEVDVTISYTEDSKTCIDSFKITIKEKPVDPVKPEPSHDIGCGGSIIASSALISLSSLMGLGLILLKRRRH